MLFMQLELLRAALWELSLGHNQRDITIGILTIKLTSELHKMEIKSSLMKLRFQIYKFESSRAMETLTLLGLISTTLLK